MSGQVTTNPSDLQIMQASVLPLLVEKLRQPVALSSRQRATLHILDWLGCAAMGVRSDNARGFINTAGHFTGIGAGGQCHTVGGEGTDWWHALQLNAAVGNMLEMDDLHRTSILHPGPIIIPAAIAVAEMVDAPAEKLLAAIVRGYEATIRIGRALGPTHYAFFHNTSTAGTFGAAAAAADLLGLNAEQTAWALANAGSRTGGLWQMRHEDCETKSLHNVVAAQTGVQAALLAQQNVRGPVSLLEGKQGLFAALAPGADAQTVLAKLEDDWLIHEVSFKPWPACRHAHPVIDAALGVLAKLRVDKGDSGIIAISTISAIDISTYKSALDFCDRLHPETELQAKFSLQHCAATVLLNGAPWLAQFAADTFTRPDVVALRAKVRLHESAEFNARFPNHYGAHIRVSLHDGRVFEHDQPDALGDPECPLSVGQLNEKARRLLTEAGVRDVDGLIAATRALNEGGTIAAFTDCW